MNPFDATDLPDDVIAELSDNDKMEQAFFDELEDGTWHYKIDEDDDDEEHS